MFYVLRTFYFFRSSESESIRNDSFITKLSSNDSKYESLVLTNCFNYGKISNHFVKDINPESGSAAKNSLSNDPENSNYSGFLSDFTSSLHLSHLNAKRRFCLEPPRPVTIDAQRFLCERNLDRTKLVLLEDCTEVVYSLNDDGSGKNDEKYFPVMAEYWPRNPKDHLIFIDVSAQIRNDSAFYLSNHLVGFGLQNHFKMTDIKDIDSISNSNISEYTNDLSTRTDVSELTRSQSLSLHVPISESSIHKCTSLLNSPFQARFFFVDKVTTHHPKKLIQNMLTSNKAKFDSDFDDVPEIENCTDDGLERLIQENCVPALSIHSYSVSSTSDDKNEDEDDHYPNYNFFLERHYMSSLSISQEDIQISKFLNYFNCKIKNSSDQDFSCTSSADINLCGSLASTSSSVDLVSPLIVRFQPTFLNARLHLNKTSVPPEHLGTNSDPSHYSNKYSLIATRQTFQSKWEKVVLGRSNSFPQISK